MTLRTRLVLAAAYLLVVVVVALEVPLARTIERREDFEYRAVAISYAALVAGGINDDIPTDPSLGLVPPAADIVLDAAETTGSRIVVVDADGFLLLDTDGQATIGSMFAGPGRPEIDAVLRADPVEGGQILTTRRFSDAAGEELLFVTAPILHLQATAGAVRLSAPVAQVRSRVYRSWLGLGLIGLGIIAVGLALAWVLAGSLTRPVRRLEEVAVRLGRGELEARATPEGPKELTTLAESFNTMAGALSANIAAQQDFLANASHQLRTPLTGLRLRLEAIEQEGGFPAQQAEKAQAELARLSKLVQDLLQLARASTVRPTGSMIELTELARESAERWNQPAEAAGKRIRLELNGLAPVWADPNDIRHVIDNLIDNAIRYCPAGTEIAIEAGRHDRTPTLVVADDGPGIPPEDRDRIFERFYRGSNGRRAGPGTGLGLAIVQELIGRWGGNVRLTDRTGTCVEATFPPAPAVP